MPQAGSPFDQNTEGARKKKSPMNEFLRRYQPVQVLRSRDSYGLGLNQAVTWYPFSHLGLFSCGTYQHHPKSSRAESPCFVARPMR